MNTDIAQQRLVNQRIGGEKFAMPEEVVRWMGALQVQDHVADVVGCRIAHTSGDGDRCGAGHR